MLEHFRRLNTPEATGEGVRVLGDSTETIVALPQQPVIEDPAVPQRTVSGLNAMGTYGTLALQRLIPGSQLFFSGTRAGVRTASTDPAASTPEATAGGIATGLIAGGPMLSFGLASAIAAELAPTLSDAAEQARTGGPDTFAGGAAAPLHDFFGDEEAFTQAGQDAATLVGESLSYGVASSVRALESLTEDLRGGDRAALPAYNVRADVETAVREAVTDFYTSPTWRAVADRGAASPFAGLDDEVVDAGLASLESSVKTLDEITKRDEPLYQRLGEAGAAAARAGVEEIIDAGVLNALPTLATVLARGGLAAGQFAGQAIGAGAQRGFEVLTSDEGERVISSLMSAAEATGRVGNNVAIGATRELLGGEELLTRGLDQFGALTAEQEARAAAVHDMAGQNLDDIGRLARGARDAVVPVFQTVNRGFQAVGAGIDAAGDHFASRFRRTGEEVGQVARVIFSPIGRLVRRNIGLDEFEQLDTQLGQTAVTSEAALGRVTTAAQTAGPATQAAMTAPLLTGEGALVPSLVSGVGYLTSSWGQALGTMAPTAGAAGLESNEALLGALVSGEGAMVPSVTEGLSLLEGSWGLSMGVITDVAASAADGAAASASRAVAAAAAAAAAAQEAARAHVGSTAPTPTRVRVTPRGPGRPAETQVGITALARGGVTTGPTLGLIGEAGPEAVLPLDGLYEQLTKAFEEALDRRGGQAEGKQTLILEIDGREVARKVVPRIPGELRLRGAIR